MIYDVKRCPSASETSATVICLTTVFNGSIEFTLLGISKAAMEAQKYLSSRSAGMRISELLQLPVDCLTQDARGVHYLRYMKGKVKRENVPSPFSTGDQVARIIQGAAGRGGADIGMTSLRCGYSRMRRGGVIKQATFFAHRINRLAYDHDIRDATGKLFRFRSHQFRHTVGTRMINLGVPHHIIQRYLGHKGPEMTSR